MNINKKEKRMKKTIVLLLVFLMVLTGTFASGQNEVAPVVKEEVGTADNPTVLKVVLKDLSYYVDMLDEMEVRLALDGIFVRFEPVELQEGSYSDAMGLMLQSGDIPDFMYFQGGDYPFAITQGILEDFTPYVENSTYIKDQLGDHAIARLENYPYLLWVSSPGNKVPVVRTDWIETMTTAPALLANPTIDNYYAFLKELQVSYTNDSSITCQGLKDGLYEIDMLFGQAFGSTTSWVKDSTGNYIYKNVADSELAKLEFYAKLYREGLLDNEYLNKKYKDKEQVFYKGNTGLIMATQNTVVAKYEKKSKAANGPTAALTVLPPAMGSDGSSYFAAIPVDKETRGWAISKYSNHKQLVFDILDWLAGPNGSMLDQFGFEGTDYELTADNKITVLNSSWWPRFHETLKTFNPNLSSEGETPLFAYPIMKVGTQMVEDHSVLDNAFMIPEDFITDWDAATQIYNEFTADFVSGKKTREDWDSFVKEWYSMGGSSVTEYANSMLD